MEQLNGRQPNGFRQAADGTEVLLGQVSLRFNVFDSEDLLISRGKYEIIWTCNNTIKNSEYDQEIPQSQTADNPTAPRGRATQTSSVTNREVNASVNPGYSNNDIKCKYRETFNLTKKRQPRLQQMTNFETSFPVFIKNKV